MVFTFFKKKIKDTHLHILVKFYDTHLHILVKFYEQNKILGRLIFINITKTLKYVGSV